MTNDGARDFDFLFGRWTYHLRRLSDAFNPDCTEWLESRATGEARPILGGLGNVDTLEVEGNEQGTAFAGATVRLYEPDTGTWRIWWTSTRTPGVLDEPVVGRFEGDRGIFECDEVINGETLRIRYTWLPDDVEPRFEQSYSRDGGATWTVNWVTTQRRREPAA